MSNLSVYLCGLDSFSVWRPLPSGGGFIFYTKKNGKNLVVCFICVFLHKQKHIKMEKPKHTPEPWTLKKPWSEMEFYEIHGADNTGVLGEDSQYNEFSIGGSNAKRIVECVNAMEGIKNPTEYMKVVKQLELDAFMKLKPEFDELRRMLQDLNTLWKRGESISPNSILARVVDEYLNM